MPIVSHCPLKPSYAFGCNQQLVLLFLVPTCTSGRTASVVAKKGQERFHVEVKGIWASSPAFQITRGEVHQASSNIDFHISIVTDALAKSPQCKELTVREFLKVYDLNPIQFMARPKVQCKQ